MMKLGSQEIWLRLPYCQIQWAHSSACISDISVTFLTPNHFLALGNLDCFMPLFFSGFLLSSLPSPQDSYLILRSWYHLQASCLCLAPMFLNCLLELGIWKICLNTPPSSQTSLYSSSHSHSKWYHHPWSCTTNLGVLLDSYSPFSTPCLLR